MKTFESLPLAEYHCRNKCVSSFHRNTVSDEVDVVSVIRKSFHTALISVGKISNKHTVIISCVQGSTILLVATNFSFQGQRSRSNMPTFIWL